MNDEIVAHQNSSYANKHHDGNRADVENTEYDGYKKHKNYMSEENYTDSTHMLLDEGI